MWLEFVPVANQRLRSAVAAAGKTKESFAEEIGVDVKTVERWITKDRLPHPPARAKAGQVLGFDETYLWPQLLAGARSAAASTAEFVQIWPTRRDVPHEVWRSLMMQTRETIEVLVYAGGFLVESLGFTQLIEEKAAAGARVRILLGDPNCEQVRARGSEEGLPTLPDRCRSTLEYLNRVKNMENVHIRTHQTPLYVSSFRFDDSLLVNTHAYGWPAVDSPVHHIERVPGGRLFSHYCTSFDSIWEISKPVG